MARNYSSIAGVKTLASDITSSSAPTLTLSETTDDLPSPPFTLVINPDTAKEEIVTVQLDQSGVSEPTYKIVRGQEDTTATTHTAGDTVKHMITARDLQEPQDHIAATEAHGATGAVVGTTNTQTLENKRLTTPKINENVTLTATSTELNVLDGITASTAELNYVDGVTSAIQTQINTVNTALTTNTPVGTIVMYGAATAPTGWLLCNGQSTAGYTALAAVVGANVPDLMGRVPVGYGSGSGLTARTTMKQEFGSESTTLTSSHIPEHLHTIDHGHAHNITANQAAHDHTVGYQTDGTNDHDHALDSGSVTRVAGPSDGGASGTGSISSGDRDPAISISGGVTNHAGNSGKYGTASPTAVTAVQPSTVVNFIIKH